MLQINDFQAVVYVFFIQISENNFHNQRFLTSLFSTVYDKLFYRWGSIHSGSSDVEQLPPGLHYLRKIMTCSWLSRRNHKHFCKCLLSSDPQLAIVALKELVADSRSNHDYSLKTLPMNQKKMILIRSNSEHQFFLLSYLLYHRI